MLTSTPRAGRVDVTGTTASIAFNCRIERAADIRVRFITAANPDPAWMSGALFSVTGGQTPTGGTIAFSPPLSGTGVVEWERVTASTQDTRLSDADRFQLASVEAALDRAMMGLQEVSEVSQRALIGPRGSMMLDPRLPGRPSVVSALVSDASGKFAFRPIDSVSLAAVQEVRVQSLGLGGDVTAAFTAAFAAVAALYAGGSLAVRLVVPPGRHGVATTGFPISWNNFAIVGEGDCVIEQLSYPNPIFHASNLTRWGARNIRVRHPSAVRAYVSEGISDRIHGMVKRAGHAGFFAYNCDLTILDNCSSDGMMQLVTAIGGVVARGFKAGAAVAAPVTSYTLPAADADGVAISSADNFFTASDFFLMDNGAGASANQARVSAYVGSTRTLTFAEPLNTGSWNPIASIVRAASTATVTTRYNHGYSTGNVVFHKGAAPTEFNVSAAVTVTSPTTYTFAVAGTPANDTTSQTMESVKCVALVAATQHFIARQFKIQHLVLPGVTDLEDPEFGILTEQMHVTGDVLRQPTAGRGSRRTQENGVQTITPHLTYGTYRNGNLFFNLILDLDSDGEAVKWRGDYQTSIVNFTLHSRTCRMAYAVMGCVGGRINVIGEDMLGNPKPQHYSEDGNPGATFGWGGQIYDCSKLTIDETWSISALARTTGGANRFAGTRIIPYEANCDDIVISQRFASKTNIDSGLALIAQRNYNVTTRAGRDVRRLRVNPSTYEQIGSAKFHQIYIETGTAQIERPTCINCGTDAVNSCVVVAEGAFGAVIDVDLDTRRLPSGFKVQKLNSPTLNITYVDEKYGSFTPAFGGSGGSPPSYSTQRGHYRRRGNRVEFHLDLYVSGAIGLTGSLFIDMATLPVNGAAAMRQGHVHIAQYGNLGSAITRGFQLNAFVNEGTNDILLYYSGEGSGAAAIAQGALQHTHVANDFFVSVSGWYFTDDLPS